MAIRIEHQPAGAAVGMAAYAAGRGKARQRQQKYAMDLWKDERKTKARRDERMAGFKYRAALGGKAGQSRLGQQAAGTWSTPPQTVMGNAQRKANARHRRMGKDGPVPYPEADPVFTPALTKDEVRRKLKREQDLDDREWKREQDRADEKRRNTRQGIMDRAKRLQPIPDWIVEPEARKKLKGLAAAISDLASNFDLSREGSREKLDELIDSYDEIITNTSKPDITEQHNRSVRYQDPVTGLVHGEFQEGWIPGRVQDGEFAAFGLSPAAEAEQAEAKKAEAAKQTKLKALETQQKKWADKLQEILNKGDEPPAADSHWPMTIQGNIDELQKQMDALESPGGGEETPHVGVSDDGRRVVVPPQESAPAAPEKDWIKNWKRTEGPLTTPETATRPLPAGMPAGAKWIDENTIQLPDGRKIQPTGGR